jgi:hypothetical protein
MTEPLRIDVTPDIRLTSYGDKHPFPYLHKETHVATSAVDHGTGAVHLSRAANGKVALRVISTEDDLIDGMAVVTLGPAEVRWVAAQLLAALEDWPVTG